MVTTFDTVVIGGGIMGCTIAFHLALAGQRVAIFERGGLCMQASGVNAGTLAIQNKPPELVPYAMRGLERWKDALNWLGDDGGYHSVGGITAAFTDADAEALVRNAHARQNAGAPIEIISADRARELEPGISPDLLMATWCPIDAYASSYRLGDLFREALKIRSVSVNEFNSVEKIHCEDHGYKVVTEKLIVNTRRVVLACGLWLEKFIRRDFGLSISIQQLVNQICVTERVAPLINSVLGVSGNLLTLKQSKNGTVLIGGGWVARQDTESGIYRIIPENLIGNLRLAHALVPALSSARLVRTWIGIDGSVDDMLPLAGELPGFRDAYVLGCVRGGGFTMGPYLGWLMARRILGLETEMRLFDPGRVLGRKADCLDGRVPAREQAASPDGP